LSGNPNQYADYFRWYTGRSSYFKFKDPKTGRVMPLMSTFGGEDVPDSQWADFKRKVGDVLIVPAFYKAAASTSFFDNRDSLDGVMNWNSWQYEGAGKIRVSSAEDAKFQTAARNTQKVFMMGISPYQYKAFSPQFNWYRRGEDNLEYRFGQALDLQPDIIQLQSWNDAGEGHFMGNVWQEPLNQRTKDLTNAYSHKGYWQILPSFIRSWKQGDRSTVNMYPTSGKAIQGTFWHHTLTAGASCDADTVVDKSPLVQQLAEDAVSGVVLVAWAYTGLVAVVNSGGREIGKMTLQPGYNSFKFANMGTGKVQLEIWDGTRIAAGGSGQLEVKSSGPLCNWNFQVVGLSV
jgi:glucan endo-1,3-alpha-glucosidase